MYVIGNAISVLQGQFDTLLSHCLVSSLLEVKVKVFIIYPYDPIG